MALELQKENTLVEREGALWQPVSEGSVILELKSMEVKAPTAMELNHAVKENVKGQTPYGIEGYFTDAVPDKIPKSAMFSGDVFTFENVQVRAKPAHLKIGSDCIAAIADTQYQNDHGHLLCELKGVIRTVVPIPDDEKFSTQYEEASKKGNVLVRIRVVDNVLVAGKDRRNKYGLMQPAVELVEFVSEKDPVAEAYIKEHMRRLHAPL